MNIAELFFVLKKNFIRLLAASLAVGLLALFIVNESQTYTCTLNFSYTYEEAQEGLAPDRSSAIKPYEIQNPNVIKDALNEMGVESDDTINVEKVRNNISITPVTEELDEEVEESAAMQGEKVTVQPTEFKITYTYDTDLGEHFGTKFFDSLINKYDDYLLQRYYNKKNITDFGIILDEEKQDYLDMANVMSENIDDAIAYFDNMATSNPNYRSKRTGYSFNDLANLYKGLRDIQYAKYYGNIRFGNLSKDPETVIKNYTAKVDELSSDHLVENEIAANYSTEIVHFYDSYKNTALYTQAQKMQATLDTTNNRDQDVLENYQVKDLINTYDGIVLNYTTRAGNASNLQREIEYNNAIIWSFRTDTVDAETKARLIEKNDAIFDEITLLSADYSSIANDTIDEYYDGKINEDFRYLISTDIATDKPVSLIVLLSIILSFGVLLIIVIINDAVKKHMAEHPTSEESKEESFIALDTSKMTELQKLFYEQYCKGFDELYLVYQPMLDCETGESSHAETFIRWRSASFGLVSAGSTIAAAIDLNLLTPFNEWIIKNICENLALRKKRKETVPVIHINCPYSAVQDFAITDMVVKYTKEYHVDIKNICIEIESNNVISCMNDISLLQNIGAKICIDRFEKSEEQDEIFEAIVPDYIKLSADVVNCDLTATTEAEIAAAKTSMIKYILKTIEHCHQKNIKACICGIENEDQEEVFLNDLGFSYKQGYLYGKPERYE